MASASKCRVIVSVTNDLVTDQRIHKVCTTLDEAGYDVTLIGRKFKNSQPVVRSYSVRRMRLFFNTSFLFYAEYNIRLFFYLLFAKADIFLANDTDTLTANYLASKLRKKALVFDAHEMFPEVPELVDRPFVKKVWTWIENWIFPKLKYTYTVCGSIADIYHEKYGIPMQVVRNIPRKTTASSNSVKPIDSKGKKVLLYQGAVNLGRGIEWMIDAMPLLDECVFYIAGDGDKTGELKDRVKQLGVEDRVIFLGRIPLEALSDYTACADIGISLLENKGLNYYFSLPNRIFDFIRKKVPILATDFPEIRKIISKYQVGELINQYEPKPLTFAIKTMLAQEIKGDRFDQANADLTWENESKTLLDIFQKASRRL